MLKALYSWLRFFSLIFGCVVLIQLILNKKNSNYWDTIQTGFKRIKFLRCDNIIFRPELRYKLDHNPYKSRSRWDKPNKALYECVDGSIIQ
jgi:hypothetical protein